MRIEPLQPGGEAEWDAFCRTQPQAWFWHTTDWTRYLLADKPQRGGRDVSFAVRDGRDLLGVAPVVVEQRELTLGGAPCWAPAAADERALRTALEHVDALAAEHGAVRAVFQLSPLTEPGAVPAEMLRAGYLEIGRTSQVLDLTVGPQALLRGMTKGHRAAVKRGADIDVELPDTHDALHEFRRLHEAAAGRATHPPEVYDRMAEWTQRSEGLLALARRDGVCVGGMYVNVFSGRAYYSSAAMDRSLSRLPIGHALQWATIERLLARGVETYELGLQQFGPALHDVPSEKELAISRFKRGFGGSLRLAPAWEKWFDADAARAALSARSEAYAAALATMRATSSAPSP